jgi:hypothetical protein
MFGLFGGNNTTKTKGRVLKELQSEERKKALEKYEKMVQLREKTFLQALPKIVEDIFKMIEDNIRKDPFGETSLDLLKHYPTLVGTHYEKAGLYNYTPPMNFPKKWHGKESSEEEFKKICEILKKNLKDQDLEAKLQLTCMGDIVTIACLSFTLTFVEEK